MYYICYYILLLYAYLNSFSKQTNKKNNTFLIDVGRRHCFSYQSAISDLSVFLGISIEFLFSFHSAESKWLIWKFLCNFCTIATSHLNMLTVPNDVHYKHSCLCLHIFILSVEIESFFVAIVFFLFLFILLLYQRFFFKL